MLKIALETLTGREWFSHPAEARASVRPVSLAEPGPPGNLRPWVVTYDNAISRSLSDVTHRFDSRNGFHTQVCLLPSFLLREIR